ncbi:MAG: hypothetical protein U9Q71_05660 [Pseudomonadota bacterium]|nr:hypothetical protein [Pseudomonadota bacterium]
MENPDAVEMALWFHDIVYSPDTEFNELKSAELFERMASGNFAPEFVAAVRKLILATEHRQTPDCCDEPYIVDIDLSSFGLSWEEYMRDNRALREEMKPMPDAQYYAGKLKFLQSLLARERIYSTEFFFDRYESRARSNIKRFVEGLAKENIL